jgi:hypothetical protein
LEQWADAIRQLRNLYRWNPDQVRNFHAMILKDPFWAPNALSPQALLRNGNDGVRKADRILAKFRTSRSAHLQMAEMAMGDDEKQRLDEIWAEARREVHGR